WMGGLAAEPYAFITNQKADNVSVIDTATGQVVRTIAVGKDPAGVAVSRDGAQVWVTNPGSRDVALIDGQHLTLKERWPVGDGPLGIALDPAGSRVYVADFYGHFVSVLDL